MADSKSDLLFSITIAKTTWLQRYGGTTDFQQVGTTDSSWIQKEDGTPDFNTEGEEKYI